MRIAIVTPACNVAQYLADTIRSVLAQTHADWSLTIIDDGSADATADIAASFADPRICLIRQPNAGVSAARNRGIAAAPIADAMLLLDGDDWLAPTALADLAETLANCPWAVAACARYARVRMDGTTTRSATPPHGVLLERLLTRNLFVNGGHLLIRAEAIAAAGRFRTDLQYGEDWEYWTRLALLGEYAAVRPRRPALFLRERAGSACHGQAVDPALYVRALDTIHGNPEIRARLGRRRLATLRRRSEAETAWAVGREMIRHGHVRDGQRWLRASIVGRPTLKRLCMMPLSALGFGPFRRYRAS